MDRHDEGVVIPLERLQAAREARDRIHGEREAAQGSSGEFALAAELEVTDQGVGARETWQRYIGRHGGV